MSEWISVKDRLPEEGVFVIVHTVKPIHGGGYIVIRKRKGWGWSPRLGSFTTEPITHWMPLPDPPKESHDDQ